MAANADSPRVITDARGATSEEMSGRVRRYTITMAFRMACFISIFFVSGWARWALFAGAVLLPYVAVLFANQANVRGRSARVARGEPSEAKQLTARPHDEVVAGEVVADDEGGNWGPDERYRAGRFRPSGPQDASPDPQDRVA